MGLAVLRKPALVLKVALPYLVLILLFSAFVAWNGSVVLGKFVFCCPQAHRLICSRRQICPHCDYTYPADALHVALHCFLLKSVDASASVSDSRDICAGPLHRTPHEDGLFQQDTQVPRLLVTVRFYGWGLCGRSSQHHYPSLHAGGQ